MSNRTLRFLHAGDFRFGEVARGLAHASPEVKRVLTDSIWTAAHNVFRHAVEQRVDFVLLNGRILPGGCEQARALAFLSDRFQELARHNIDVYWRTRADQEICEWGRCFEWPQNVHLLDEGTQAASWNQNGQLRVRISGGRFVHEPTNVFTIALASGSVSSSNADYVAGCGADRGAVGNVNCPGAVQGLGFDEPGPHGCSLIEVDEHNRAVIGLLECNTVAWETLRFPLRNVETIETVLLDAVRANMRPGVARMLHVIPDARELGTDHLGLPDAESLRVRLQSHFRAGECWINEVEIETSLRTTTTGRTCVDDFCGLVAGRGEDCTQSLLSRRLIDGAADRSQLLYRVARLGSGLLS